MEVKKEEGIDAKAAVKPLRAAMPGVAAIVDDLRAWAEASGLGASAIDKAMASGQRRAREYQAQLQANGKAAADRWLRAQPNGAGGFWASEGGREVGIRRP